MQASSGADTGPDHEDIGDKVVHQHEREGDRSVHAQKQGGLVSLVVPDGSPVLQPKVCSDLAALNGNVEDQTEESVAVRSIIDGR